MAVVFLLHLKFNLQAARHPTAAVSAQDLVWCAAGGQSTVLTDGMLSTVKTCSAHVPPSSRIHYY
jgi:hypothetical protein